MATLAQFYPAIKPYAPTFPNPALDAVLLDAAIEFCRDSRVLRYAAEPFMTSPRVGAYEMDIDAGDVDIFEALSASADGKALEPQRLRGKLPAFGTPEGFWMADRNTISLWPVPDRALEVRALCAVCPRAQAMTVDDALLRDWRNGIVAGALFRLALTPDGGSLAGANWAEIYSAEVRRAAALASQSFVRAPLRVAPCV
jgi:hypothetical protein